MVRGEADKLLNAGRRELALLDKRTGFVGGWHMMVIVLLLDLNRN